MKFEDLLTEHNVPVAPEGHEHTRPGWLQFDCPFCSKDWKHYRMGFNLRNRYVNCWSCGQHGLVKTLAHATGLSYGEIKSLVDDIDRGPAIEKAPRGKLVIPMLLTDLCRVHRKYLQHRGFDPDELIALWSLMCTTMDIVLPWRIFVPITYHGETVSWTTRKITDQGLRWRSASAGQEAMNHKELLYGQEYVRHAAIVVEGPSDVWNIGPATVATCGTGYSQAQVNRMSKISNRIVCFDSSPDAQARASDLCDALSVFPGTTTNVVLDAADPGSAKPKEVRALRRLLRG